MHPYHCPESLNSFSKAQGGGPVFFCAHLRLPQSAHPCPSSVSTQLRIHTAFAPALKYFPEEPCPAIRRGVVPALDIPVRVVAVVDPEVEGEGDRAGRGRADVPPRIALDVRVRAEG